MAEEGLVVRDAGMHESDAVIDLLTLAFCKDPTMRWLFSDANTFVRSFPPFARAFGGRAFEAGTAHVGGDFTGAATWLPPGVHSDADEVGRILVDAVSPEKLVHVTAMLEEMDAYHPEDPHWYLAIIGVDPAGQGQGAGSSLLAHALERCDRARLPAYLESSNPANIPLYERFGFEVQGEIQHGDSPPVHPMHRAAR